MSNNPRSKIDIAFNEYYAVHLATQKKIITDIQRQTTLVLILIEQLRNYRNKIPGERRQKKRKLPLKKAAKI